MSKSKSKSKTTSATRKEDPSITTIAAALEPETFVVLRSSDGHDFFLGAECAHYSQYIKDRRRDEELRVFDPDIATPIVEIHAEGYIVEKVVQYMYYKRRWDHDPENRPEFHIDPEDAVQLLMAASLLKT